MKNKKILKNLLATASALAVISSGASALAVVHTIAAASSFSGLPVATGDSIVVNGANLAITADLNNVKIASIDLANNAGTSLTVQNAFELDEITSTGGAQTIATTFDAAADKNVVLKLNNGANYGSIGDIDLNGSTGVVWIGQDVDISTGDVTLGKGTFTALGASGNVATAKDITGIDGGTVDLTYATVNDITVAAGKTGNIKLNEGSTAGGDIDLQAGTLTMKGIGAGADSATAHDITITTGTADIKDYAATGVITITDKGNASVNGANSVITKVALNNKSATLNLAAGTVTTVSTAGTDGIVNVTGNSAIGTLGAANNAIAAVNLSNDATLTLGANAAFATAITTDVDGKGTVKLAHNLTVETVGAAGKKLKAITFNGVAGKVLKVTGKEFHTDVIGGNIGLATGKVQFAADITVDGLLGDTATGALAEVVVGDVAAAKVKFGDNLQNVAKLSFANIAGSEATISSVGNKAMVVDATANGGTLILENPKDLELATVGAANALTEVRMSGAGNVKISGADFKTGKLSAKKAAKDARIEVNKLDDIAAYEVEETGLTVAFRDNSTLAGHLGAKDKSIKELRLVGAVAKNLDMNAKNAFGANIVADKADVLSVANVGVVDGVYGSFGTADARLVGLTFAAVAGNGATVNGEVYSNAITTAATKVKFLKSLYGKDDKSVFTLAAGDDITFADGVNFTNMQLGAAKGVNGVLTFEGSTNVGSISADKITFAAKAGSVRNLNDNITAANAAADAVAMNEGTYNFVGGKTVTGKVTTNKAVLNLGAGKTTFASDITAGDTTTVNLTDRTSQFSGLNVDTTKTNFNVSAVILGGDELKDAIHFTGAATSKITIGSGNRFNTFTTKSDAAKPNDLTVVSAVNTGFVDSYKNVNETSKNLLQALTSIKDYGSVAYNLLNLVAGNTISDAKGSEALNRMTSTSNTTAVTSSAATMAMASVADRISSFGHTAAPAAGEEDEAKFGVWGQAFGSKATQKARKGEAGYKANAMGGTVGADTMISENTMLGIATTYAESDVKFKDFKAGDKAKSTNMFFNLYAKHDLGNNWFVQGATNFGKGEVKSDAKRVTGATTYDVASAKYDTMAFGMEARVGYNVRVADATMLVPTLGLAYVNVNEAGFSEKGSVFNRTVTKKAADKLTGTLGAAVLGNMDMNGMEFAPEAHAYVNYDLKAKAAKADVRLDGLANAVNVTAAKAAKVSYDLGTSLNAKSGMVNYGVGYDAKLSEKFVAHQGTFRVRVDL